MRLSVQHIDKGVALSSRTRQSRQLQAFRMRMALGFVVLVCFA